MKKTDEKLDNLIVKLRQAKPVLTDAQLITDKIMQRIKMRSSQPKSHILIWFRSISGAAAILLLGIFLFQLNDAQSIAINNKPTHFIENKINIDSLCFQDVTNKRADLMHIYFCYMQCNSIKNEQSRSFIKQLNN